MPKDENGRDSIICASNADGKTIVVVKATNVHALEVDDDTTGTDHGNDLGNASLDENSVPVWTVLSSAGDGSIIEVYGDPANGKILIDSN